MSLFDCGAARKILKGGNNGNNNQNNRNNNRGGNNNNQKNHNSGKSASQQKQQKLANKAAEIIRRFDSDDESKNANYSNDNSSVDAVKEVLSAFVSVFEKNVDKPSEIKELIESDFEDVVAAMRYYYDPKFESVLPEMNRLLDIMSTNHFATTLLGVLKQNSFGDWDEMWKDVAITISILLETSSSKMKEGTVQTYVSDILSSNGMWRNEIDQMTSDIGITEELAIDLVIGLPVKPEDMNDLLMRSTYQSFLWAILEHAEDNIEVLDSAAQRKLFDFFFEDGRNGKLACKVVGRYLSDGEPETELSGAASLIYGEFKAMLLEKLESYDVNNIAFVLRFIVDQKKRNENGKQNTLFNAEEAAKYDTIRKAIMQVISKDETAKAYLV